MGLMERIRGNTHIMLWILILAFVGLIVFEWGASFNWQGGGAMGQPKFIAEINGEKIEPQQYFNMLQQEYERYRQQTGDALTDQQRNQIEDQLWNEIVNQQLIQQEVNARDIIVTNTDIIRSLRENPPAFLRQVEAFQTDGEFDYQKYLQALNNPVGDEWVTVEQYVRASLPSQKLQSTLLASVIVTENEVRREYMVNNVDYTVEYLYLPIRNISDDEAQPAESDIQDYYNENIENYEVPERRSLQYVLFPTSPSGEDSTDAYETAMEVIEQARQGVDFAELAQEYSDGPTANSGGDLGWFGQGEMVPGFEQVAFEAEPGTFVGPVLTQFGYHVIYVRDKRTQGGQEQVQASHVLINIEASALTRDEMRSEANLFLFDAQDYSFEASADSHNVPLQTTPLFEQNQDFVPGLGQFEDASDFAFQNPMSTVSEVMENENGYYIFRVNEIQEPLVRPLEEVRGRITQQLRVELKKQIALERAQEIRAQISDSKSMQTFSESDTTINYIQPAESFTLAGNIPGVGRVAEFKGALKALNVGQISPAIKTDRGAYIIHLLNKSDFNEELFEQQRVQLRQQILSQKQNQFMNQWLQSLRANAEIVDNRDAFM